MSDKPPVVNAWTGEPILPRDCDGGLTAGMSERQAVAHAESAARDDGMADANDAAPDFHQDERIGIAEDEQDNTAMIARDLAALRNRWFHIRFADAGGERTWDHINTLLIVVERALDKL